MRRPLALAAILAAVLGAIGAPSASAAVEFGDNCTANDSTEGNLVTIFELASPGPLPAAAPISGVITKLRSNLVPAPVAIPVTMKVLRVNGPNTVLTVGETAGAVTGGGSSFDVRIPVQTGDHLSIFGSPPYGTLFCETADAITLAGFPGAGAPPGGTTPFLQEVEPVRVPLSGVIEPDADNDGYGDETQDRCPQSATTQSPCPLVVLDSFVLPSRNKAVVIVSTSFATRVTVSGTAKLPKTAGKAGVSAKAKLKGVSKTAMPGKLNRFTLNFPAPLRSAIAALPPGKTIRVEFVAKATDLTGKVAEDKSQLKLKG